MARAGRATAAAGVVPAELLRTFEEHRVWFSEADTRAWFDRHRLEWSASPWTHTPPGRRDAAVRAWCMANGLEHPKWPNLLDHKRVRALGITESTRGSVRLRYSTSPSL